MQELAGRLTALDPEASESLKVIAYFDALVTAGVGLESLVRAATILSGVAAGAHTSGRVIRVDAAGRRADGADGAAGAAGAPGPGGEHSGRYPQAPLPEGGAVWIERTDSPHANDAMILERLALAAGILLARRGSRDGGALERVLDGAVPLAERAAALHRLRLDGVGPLRITARVAGSAERPVPDGEVSATVVSADGLVQAGLSPLAVSLPEPRGGERVGYATATDAAALPAAWDDARLALRLADHRHPVVGADDLGAMIVIARSFDPAAPLHPDVTALRGLDPRSREMLDELVDAESVRAAASALGMHHSSLQARHESWTHQLGFDPRSPRGRARYEAARLLCALAASSSSD